jgi:hypothetical protein
MATFTPGLAFRPHEGTIPAEFGIYIKSYAESGTRFGQRSLKMLALDCLTAGELETEADRPIRELERLKRQARPLFRRSRHAWLKKERSS